MIKLYQPMEGVSVQAEVRNAALKGISYNDAEKLTNVLNQLGLDEYLICNLIDNQFFVQIFIEEENEHERT